MGLDGYGGGLNRWVMMTSGWIRTIFKNQVLGVQADGCQGKMTQG